MVSSIRIPSLLLVSFALILLSFLLWPLVFFILGVSIIVDIESDRRYPPACISIACKLVHGERPARW